MKNVLNRSLEKILLQTTERYAKGRFVFICVECIECDTDFITSWRLKRNISQVHAKENNAKKRKSSGKKNKLDLGFEPINFVAQLPTMVEGVNI